jgi:hypothetical protein
VKRASHAKGSLPAGRGWCTDIVDSFKTLKSLIANRAGVAGVVVLSVNLMLFFRHIRHRAHLQYSTQVSNQRTRSSSCHQRYSSKAFVQGFGFVSTIKK